MASLSAITVSFSSSVLRRSLTSSVRLSSSACDWRSLSERRVMGEAGESSLRMSVSDDLRLVKFASSAVFADLRCFSSSSS